MSGSVNIDEVNPEMYKFFMNVYKTFYMAGAVAAVTGGICLLLNNYIDQKTSGLIKDILYYSLTTTIGGVASALTFGSQYYVNRSINNRHQSSNSETQQ